MSLIQAPASILYTNEPPEVPSNQVEPFDGLAGAVDDSTVPTLADVAPSVIP